MRVPSATYRLQLNGRFGFADARAILPHLEALGVSDLYASPLLQARRGSTHGYDTTDPTRLNGEIGSARDFDELTGDLKARGMGLLLDIVPNHMATGGENRWWLDVLEAGAASPFSEFFDIDWHPPRQSLAGRVLLPVLAGPYGRILENRELVLRRGKGGFFLHYAGLRLPLALRSYARILAHRLESLEAAADAEGPGLRELRDLIGSIEALPDPAAPETGPSPDERANRELVKQALWDLCRRRGDIGAFVDQNVRIFNGRKSEPGSFDLLDRLLGEQPYWLAYWRLANEEINYRRFFAISDLVSLRVEEPRVFAASHALILRLAAAGKVTGLRVDHIDGLLDPHGYLEQLTAHLAAGAAAGDPDGFYVVVEKILAQEEALPPEWPVAGTTGYEFLNLANRLFVSATGLRAVEALAARILGERLDFEDLVHGKKRLVIESLFGGEMHALGRQLGELAERDRHARDLPRKELREGLEEVTACFPVYRTYIRSGEISSRDRLFLGRALKTARRRNPGLSPAVFDFLRRVLLLERPGDPVGEAAPGWIGFVMRWQQFTGPIMAKGLEDTALYAYTRLVSLNEVGGDPGAGGLSPQACHQRLQAAQQLPHRLNATSTHDTKRSEDVRARINVLSELPVEWERHLVRWHELNEDKKRLVGSRMAPDREEEILLYQTLLGVWPLDPGELPALAKRVQDYMVKAAREARRHTGWIRPAPEYERALVGFVGALLDPGPENAFLQDFLVLQRRISRPGAMNGLAQLLVKIASPGVPDFYQGTELWNLRLVDPDNRSPVDFAAAARLRAGLEEQEARGRAALIEELLAQWEDGRIKLYVTMTGLRFRKQQPELFRAGAYHPLAASGEKKEHLFAFARRTADRAVIAAVPRLSAHLSPPDAFPLGRRAWGSRAALLLPEGFPGRWRNVFTDEILETAADKPARSLLLREIFKSFPVALLESLT